MKSAVLLSGGVDSSVALSLALKQGHELVATYLKIWMEEEMAGLGDCPWQEDLEYAQAVTEQLQVPLNVLPLQGAYMDKVVSIAIQELKAGRTPSPDILCNRRIKFGAFVETLDSEFEAIISGHYARRIETDDGCLLARSPDPVKDQTYFLCFLTQQQLQKARFPIGELDKSQVRALAEELKLPTMNRKDSQGICFLGKIKYRDFVAYHLGQKKGHFRKWPDGEILGEHDGYWYYTIGQRKGLGLGGGPWYVVSKDCDENIIWLCHADQHQEQHKTRFEVESPHWILHAPQKSRLEIKLRHGPALVGAEILSQTDQHLSIQLDEPDPGIAPGQCAVFYDGEICLGGATINAVAAT